MVRVGAGVADEIEGERGPAVCFLFPQGFVVGAAREVAVTGDEI